MLARQACVFAGLQRRLERERRQPRAVGLRLEHEAVGVRIGQLVLLELHRQRRHALVDLAHALLLRLIELGAGADEVVVVLLGDAPLFRFERRAVLVHLLDAREQRRIEIHLVAERREFRAHFALDALDIGVGVRRRPVREDRLHAAQQLAAALKALDGVAEGAHAALHGDRPDLGPSLGDAGLEGGHEVRFLDEVEGRCAIRQRPGLQKGVARGVGERSMGGGDGDHGGGACGGEEITTIHGALRTTRGDASDVKGYLGRA